MSAKVRLSPAMVEMLKRMDLTGSWFNPRHTGGPNEPGWAYPTFHALVRRGLVDENTEKMTAAGRSEVEKRRAITT